MVENPKSKHSEPLRARMAKCPIHKSINVDMYLEEAGVPMTGTL